MIILVSKDNDKTLEEKTVDESSLERSPNPKNKVKITFNQDDLDNEKLRKENDEMCLFITKVETLEGNT